MNVTVFDSPALMMLIFLRSTMGVGDFWMVKVTPMLNSWKSPESDTTTLNARSVDAVIWLSVAAPLALSFFPSGSAVTETRALPWFPVTEDPPVAAPWTRRQTCVIARVLARSGFGMMLEAGTPPMSLMPCRCSSSCVGSLK